LNPNRYGPQVPGYGRDGVSRAVLNASAVTAKSSSLVSPLACVSKSWNSTFASATEPSLTWPIAESSSEFFREVLREDFLRLGLSAEGMIVSLVDVVLHLGRQRWSDFTAAGFTAQMRSVGIELRFEGNEHRTARSEFLIGDSLLNFALPSFTFALNAAASNFLPGTANSSIKASSKLRRLSIVASLPVFVKVAVPQLSMRLAATQRKAFRATGVEFIRTSF
jgi:hypothetical protein